MEYWLYSKLEEILLNNLLRCEERNKNQRESLNKKYSIVKIDELLEKADCLERKVWFLENPRELEEYFKEDNPGEDFILKDYIAKTLDC